MEKIFCLHQKDLTKVWKSSKKKFKMTISKFWSLIIQNLPKSMAVWVAVQFLFNKFIIYIEMYLRMMSDLLLRQVWKRKTPDLKIWDLSRIKSKIQKYRRFSILFFLLILPTSRLRTPVGIWNFQKYIFSYFLKWFIYLTIIRELPATRLLMWFIRPLRPALSQDVPLLSKSLKGSELIRRILSIVEESQIFINPGAAGCTQKCANGFSARFSLSSENLRNFSSGLKSIIFNALSAQMVKISTKWSAWAWTPVYSG